MIITDSTIRNLELDYIFSKIKVYSPHGKELKKELSPFDPDEKDKLINEYNRIEKVINKIDKDRYSFVELRNNFKKVKSLKLTFEKIRNNDILTVTEFFEIKNFLFIIKDIEKILNQVNMGLDKNYQISRIKDLEELLDPAGNKVNSFYIYDEYSKKLKEIRRKLNELNKKQKVMKNKLIEECSEKYDIKIRRNGEVSIDKENSDLVDELRESENFYYKSETFMNVTFEIKNDEKMDGLKTQIEELKLVEEKESNKIRKQLSERMTDFIENLEKNYKNIGNLDLLIGKSFFSYAFDGVKPEILTESKIVINEGRHLLVEEDLRKKDKNYIPVSVELERGVTVLTGANMGGKTVSLKMIGFLVYMAQLGLFIPADRFCFKPMEYIFTSVGDDQNINRGLSSFGAEIENVKIAIKSADKNGLILIDELARGTNPKEGFALSKALIEFFKKKNSITFISTHFDGLTKDGVKHLQVKGLNEITEDVSFENIQEHMDYRLIEAKSNDEVPKDALNISKILGLEPEIIKNAEKILYEGE